MCKPCQSILFLTNLSRYYCTLTKERKCCIEYINFVRCTKGCKTWTSRLIIIDFIRMASISSGNLPNEWGTWRDILYRDWPFCGFLILKYDFIIIRRISGKKCLQRIKWNNKNCCLKQQYFTEEFWEFVQNWFPFRIS